MISDVALLKLAEAVKTLPSKVIAEADRVEIVAEGDQVSVRFDPPVSIASSLS